MKAIKAFIKSHPVLTYFGLVLAISWGGVLIVVGPYGIPATNKEQYETLFPTAIVAMVAGPSVAGILLTALLYGRAGLQEFGSRLLKWRVGARWYAVALLTAPLLFTGVNLALSLTSTKFLPSILTSDDRASVRLMGIGGGPQGLCGPRTGRLRRGDRRCIHPHGQTRGLRPELRQEEPRRSRTSPVGLLLREHGRPRQYGGSGRLHRGVRAGDRVATC